MNDFNAKIEKANKKKGNQNRVYCFFNPPIHDTSRLEEEEWWNIEWAWRLSLKIGQPFNGACVVCLVTLPTGRPIESEHTGGRFQRSKPGLRSNWFHRQVTVIYDRLWPNSIPLKIYALHIPIHAIKVERGAQILSFYLNLIYVEEKGRVYQSGQLPYLFLSFQVFRSLPFLSHVVDYFWLRWLTSFVLTLRQDDGIFSHYNKWRCPATILKNFRFL